MRAANGRPVTQRERLLLEVAAAMVRAWLLDPTRQPLRPALLTQAERYLLPNGLTPADCPDVRPLANAIRTSPIPLPSLPSCAVVATTAFPGSRTSR